jgi:site-specific recombinase XerD
MRPRNPHPRRTPNPAPQTHKPRRRPRRGSPEELVATVELFRRHLIAGNKAPSTIASYTTVARHFANWLLQDDTRPSSFTEVDHHHISDYIAELLQRRLTASTAATYYRTLQQLYRWLVETEEVIDRSPFDRLRPPHVPDIPIPVIPDRLLRDLLDTCRTWQFTDVRDAAIIRILFDCGLRRAEVAGLTLSQGLDLTDGLLHVMGKGRRPRPIPYSLKTADALHRYLRARPHHPLADLDALWLGTHAPLSGDGIRQMLERRCDLADIEHLNPHRFRHTSVDMSLEAGLSEGDAMRIYGWQSRQMLDRYAATRATQRALTAKRRITPADRI